MEIVSRLLPDSTHLRLDTWQLNEAENQITLTLAPIQTVAHCPICDVPARRIHSRYTRTLADLPWGGYGVRLQLHVRKFFCAVAGCKRRIFTERLCGVAPWARRTQRLSEQLTAIGLALGGAPGARLSRCLGVSISHDTLLRLARRVPLPTASTPSILGIDDWAYRKRTTYGTILVDLERRRPVTLLNDREAETLADWLRDHPGVSVISRDRMKAYIDGARAGAPQATQVADRFHLLQNLAEALDQVFSAHGSVLKAVREAISAEPVTGREGTVAVPVPPAAPTAIEEARAKQRRARRWANYERVWDSIAKGGLTAPSPSKSVLAA